MHRYTKYTGDLLGEIDLDNLARSCPTFCSRADSTIPEDIRSTARNEHTLEDLKKAIHEALNSAASSRTNRIQQMMERADGNMTRPSRWTSCSSRSWCRR